MKGSPSQQGLTNVRTYELTYDPTQTVQKGLREVRELRRPGVWLI